MEYSDISFLVPTCNKFSDILPGCIKSLRKFWPEFDGQICVVTDFEPSLRLDDAAYYIAGDIEYSDRLKYALEKINSKYVVICLDDYYINKTVDDIRFNKIFDLFKKNNIDYVRLFTKSFREKDFFDKDLDLKIVDLSYHRYKVNLYIGIWKRETFIKMCQNSQNPWQFEVSLTQKMEAINGKCLTLDTQELFSIADVVRKGRITRNTYKYIRKNALYSGNRKKQSIANYCKLKLMDWYKSHASVKSQTRMKRLLKKLGFKFYSDWDK